MKMRFHWGTGIAVTYAAFAVSTLGFVAFALGRPVDLVSADYYARSLAHDERLAAARGARALGDAVRVELAQSTVIVAVPRDHVATLSGSVTLYRPSGAGLDRAMALEPAADGVQRIEAHGLAPGRWIVQVQWRARGREFFHEQAVIVR